jgi:hypothetical protein
MPNILTGTIWQYFKSSIATRLTDCVTSPLINNIAAIAPSFILPRRGGDAEGARTILVVCPEHAPIASLDFPHSRSNTKNTKNNSLPSPRKRFLPTLEMTESHFDACTIVS